MLDTVAALGDSEGEALQVRIGIHTGPVVGGVIGKTKFIYDLWGDTVNTASRMENASAPGAILVTTEVQARVGHAFELSHRGELEIRGKGRVDTWWLRGSKASAPAP
jgi:class 3 adenylate cyclase